MPGEEKIVWVIRFGDYEPAEIEDIYATRERAELALGALETADPEAPWRVQPWRVQE